MSSMLDGGEITICPNLKRIENNVEDLSACIIIQGTVSTSVQIMLVFPIGTSR